MAFTQFSAKNLCTMSASQIKYLCEHSKSSIIKNKINENILYGDAFAKSYLLGVKDKVIGTEMRSTINLDGYTIHACHDAVLSNFRCERNALCEIKSIRGKYEDWYFISSIFQCLVYYTIFALSSHHMQSASFTKENNSLTIPLENLNKKYFLKFGDTLYEIILTYDVISSVKEYLRSKCEAINCDWNYVKSFDKLNENYINDIVASVDIFECIE